MWCSSEHSKRGLQNLYCQIFQSSLSRIERRFRKAGHVREFARSGRSSTFENKKLNVNLSIEENSQPTQETWSGNGIGNAFVRGILKKKRYHPYKIELIRELNEGNLGRRLEIGETIMNICNSEEF